jgi:hypothetical protein
MRAAAMQVTDDRTTTADNVALFPGTKTESEEPRRRKAKTKTGARRDPTAALRKRRQRAKQDRDGHAENDQPDRDEGPAGDEIPQAGNLSEIKTHVTVRDAPALIPDGGAQASKRHGFDVVAYGAAIALASAAAWFSIRGMVVLFPGAPQSVVAMAVSMEAAKLVTAGWLARSWRATAWLWRLAVMAFVFGLAVINAAGVYAQLVAAHLGERGAATSAIETQDAALAAKIEVAASRVADLDRQIDAAVAAATQRGKATTGVSVMEGQRKARAGLAGEREKAAGALAALKTERARVTAKGHQIETEAAPIRYVAELVGADTDSERAIRWLIALMVLCCDPLAIALTAAASARRNVA